jgi:hypothetical protein
VRMAHGFLVADLTGVADVARWVDLSDLVAQPPTGRESRTDATGARS